MGSADDPGHQIVVVRLSDLAAIERSRHELFVIAKIVDEQFAVNFRSVHLSPAFPQEAGLFRGSERERIKLPAYEPALALPADLALELHQLAPTALDLPRRDLVRQMIGGGALLVGVVEDAEPVELRRLNEIAQ